MYSSFPDRSFPVDREALQKSNEQIEQSIKVSEAAQQQQAEEDNAAKEQFKQDQQKIDPKTGKPKSAYDTLNPKQFGIAENAQEAVNAVGGGAVDAVNSVLSIPKFLDPTYYKPGVTEYKPPFFQFEKPITRTVWGSVLRTGVEFMALSAVTRRAAKPAAGMLSKGGQVGQTLAKPLNYLSSTRTTVRGRLVQDAAAGVAGDLISNQSQDGNLAQMLGEMKPEWKNALAPISTTASMSPAQRALMNTGESLGLGPLIGGAFEAAGAGVRGIRGVVGTKRTKAANPEVTQIYSDKRLEEVKAQEEQAYQSLTKRVEDQARLSVEKAAHKQQKKQLLTDETFTQWQTRVRNEGQSPWDSLPDDQKLDLMKAEAKKRDVDWGPERNYDARMVQQADQTTDVAVDRITRNEVTPDDAFVYEGGTPERGNVLSADRDPMASLRDMEVIKRDFTQAEGSPRGVLTDAQIKRMEVGAPGMTALEAERLADFYASNPDFQRSYGQQAKKTIQRDLLDVQVRVNEFLDESGNFRNGEITDEDLTDFLGTLGNEAGGSKFGGNITEGNEILNTSQLMATDVLVGSLLKQVRDISRAAGSVVDEVDVMDKDSLGDMIFSRIATLARLRKETSMLNSYSLRMMSSGKDGSKKAAMRDMDFMNDLTEASDAAVAQVNVLKQVLKDDPSDALLNTYLEFLAAGGDRISTMKDLDAFFMRKLHGYREGDQGEKSAIVRELQSMMVHSFLSGPRTAVRAWTGTGIATFMRPVSAIVGSMGDYAKGDDQVTRSAFAGIGAMMESLGDAWGFAKQRWSGQIMGDTPTAKSIADDVEYSKMKDLEWAAIGEYVDSYGSLGDQWAYGTANMIRWLNKAPMLNWSARAMAAGDQFFGHLLARARVRQLAFNDAYATLKETKGFVSDADAKDLTRMLESKFQQQVWSADGQLQDGLLRRAQEEVSLTEDLRGWAADFERAVEKAPVLKPFMLFMRTGINSLKLVSKHTPLLNRTLEEVQDIRTLAWDDPKMLSKYGVKSPEDHAELLAVTNGRVALGYSAVAVASTLYLNGHLTGNGPSDQELRNSWTRLKWQPRSIKLGNTYVSYDALEPFNTFLSTVADIGDASKEMGEDWTKDSLGRLGFILSMNVTNKTFLTGIQQFIDLVQMKGTKPASAIANIANGTLPWAGFRNELGRLISPGMRELDNGIQDSLRNRNLWAEFMAGPDGKLPYRYDVLDGSIIRDYDVPTRLFNTFSPMQINPGVSPTREMLFRSGLDLKTTFNTGPNGEVLTAKMKSEFNRILGQQKIESRLEKLFKNPQIASSILDMEAARAARLPVTADDTLHGMEINRIIYEAKKNAWSELLAANTSVQKESYKADLKQLSTKARQSGDTQRANQLLEWANR
jgi:hypothetical protein